MKSYLFRSDNDSATSRLILLFAGWGMDYRPFRDLSVPGYDLCVLWDYRSHDFPAEKLLEEYEEIVIVAWSFGVPAASEFILHHKALPITATIAINGTQHPVNDELGIPETIFQGTLDMLTERSLGKFYLRMAGSADMFKEFAVNYPERNIDELKEELKTIKALGSPILTWDKAIVADSDRIIPSANQLRAWEKEAIEIRQYPGAHLPAFQSLLTQLLTDKSLVTRRFRRATATYDANAVIQKHIAEHLIYLWDANMHRNPDILEIGCGTGYSTRLIFEKTTFTSLRLWDLTLSEQFVDEYKAKGAAPMSCDAEISIMALPSESIDVIVSASTVQWFNSLPTFMRHVKRVLRPGGTAIISTFGPETMREINSTLSKKSPYPSTETLRRMIPQGLDIIQLSEETLTITFQSPIDVLRHVRLTGVNALSTSASPAVTRSLLRSYPLLPTSEAPLTYQPIYIILTKPHSQS